MKEKIIQIIIDKDHLVGLSSTGKVYRRLNVSTYTGRIVWDWVEIMCELGQQKHEDY